jgi:DNA-binding transcriptional LysR family regulator
VPPLDLNLLVALDALLREQSVARAAARLHVTPSAMSRTLTRLREAVGDPLLVRAGRGLVPTPRALALRDRVHRWVAEAETLLVPETPRSPAEFRRVFTIRANDGVLVGLGAELLARVQAEAPGVIVRFVVEGEEDVAALRDGVVDLDIGVQDALGPEVRVQSLLVDRFAVLVAANSPLRGRPNLEQVCAVPHIVISRRGKTVTLLDEQLAARGLRRTVTAVVPNTLAAAALVAQGRGLALVADTFARRAPGLLPVRRLPLPLPLGPIPIAQAWHPRFDDEPAHRWLRASIKQIAAELGAPERQ